MSGESYSVNTIVLRKTPLGEGDLIITLLAEDGSQLRCVAKGARKPTSAFSARLELYSVAEVHCVRGRSLDIVKEARLIDSNARVRVDLERSSCAAPIAELLDAVSHEGLSDPRLFPMAKAVFAKMGDASAAQALSLSVAELIKMLCVVGFRPSIDTCVHCGKPVDIAQASQVRLSDIDGGVICDQCASFSETRIVDANILAWCKLFIGSTFDEVVKLDVDPSVSFAVLEFVHQWTRVHVGKTLKSLNFLFTCGLF